MVDSEATSATGGSSAPAHTSKMSSDHPLGGPLGGDGDDLLGGDDEDIPSSFHPQGTLRGRGTIRAPQATTLSRPGYFDLQRLAAQADLADEMMATRRRTSDSRAASVYSVSSSRVAGGDDGRSGSQASDSDGEDAEEEEATPSWIHDVTARRSPLPKRFQPRPIAQPLNLSPNLSRANDGRATPSVPDDVSKPELLDPIGKLEEELKQTRTEVERWRRLYEEAVARHARELMANKKANEARETSLMEIVTAAGISKARVERALTHATAQSLVPIFRADERVAEQVTRTRSPLPSTARRPQQPYLPVLSPSRSLSSEDKLPASIMEAMLDEFHAESPLPPRLNASSSQISAHSSTPSQHSGTGSRSHSPTPSVRSTASRKSAPVPSATPASSAGNSFFTLNWRRKKAPASTANKSREAIDSMRARVGSSEMSTAAIGAAAATLNKTLKKNGRRSVSRQGEPNVTRLPGFFGQGGGGTVRQKTRYGTHVTGEGQSTITPSQAREMEPMLAHDVRPPTLAVASGRRSRPALDRLDSSAQNRTRSRRGSQTGTDDDLNEYQSSGDEFEVYGGKHLSPEELAQRVSSSIQKQREAGEEDAMLTDRYGFVYDATPADVRLLRRARKEASHAPACLTGIRVGVRARGGTDSQSEDEKASSSTPFDSDSDVAQETPVRVEIDDDDKDKAGIEASLSHASRSDGGTVFDPTPSPALTTPGMLDLTSAKPVVSSTNFNAAGASQASNKVGPTSPEEERLHFLGQDTLQEQQHKTNSTTRTLVNGNGRRPPSTSQTVRRLLAQMQEMHVDQQQKQQASWDTFLERRKAVLRERSDAAQAAAESSITSKAVGAVRKGGDALGWTTTSKTEVATPAEEEWTLGGLVGLGQMGSGTKDRQDFHKLIQNGIPLIYRPKIWYECSGAMELAEPGRYEELLKEHEDEENTCTKQIDLDVGRTMPTNIYFAGDGPGVIKLRRLLVAFSWYNPKCGYCQGMNNLAATLLLTHATEEEAFWVLASMIERIMPEDYFTAHLLVAQADQRVVIDLVRDHLPKLTRHMDELGVDLPAITFAWFLSLYTDCLPVETLFRVWDVLFVDGVSILFRVALAIFLLNEKDLLATQSPSAFYSLMHSMTSHLFSADKLITLASEGLASTVKMDKIEQRRAQHIVDLCAELGLDPATLAANDQTSNFSSIR